MILEHLSDMFWYVLILIQIVSIYFNRFQMVSICISHVLECLFYVTFAIFVALADDS